MTYHLFKYFLFGITISFNIFAKNNPVIVLSIPKSGTHMVAKCIGLIMHREKANKFSWLSHKATVDEISKLIDSEPENAYFKGHLGYDAELEKLFKLKNCKIFFIYRDPRSQASSWIRWINRDNNMSRESLSENILLLINGLKPYGFCKKFNDDINGLYREYMPWAICKDVFALRFEDLVGANGGGDEKKQYSIVEKMANYLGIIHDTNDINKICKKLFGNTTTFSQGQIDGWKKYFSQQHKDAFKKHAGQLLIDLGYEKDFNW